MLGPEADELFADDSGWSLTPDESSGTPPATESAGPASGAVESLESIAPDAEMLDGDLESAYRRALEVLEQSDQDIASLGWDESDQFLSELGQEPPNDSAPGPTSSVENSSANNESAVGSNGAEVAAAGASPTSRIGTAAERDPLAEQSVTPQQVIEACLFVGGTALTANRLAAILKGETIDAAYVERAIDELNHQYASENRPYEIQLRDTGYVLMLRDEYERLRNKVYGLGPKEVRIAQDVLEVLALVAYEQPITESALVEHGKTNAGSALRQLLRRELIAVERQPDQPKVVFYRTTPRFLSLFGLGSVNDLPRADILRFK